MDSSYNIEEVFDIAVEIETRGAAFYIKAAERTEDSEVRDLFRSLSQMEEKHIQAFTGMKQEYLAEKEKMNVYDPDDEMSRYLEQVAQGHGWEGKSLPDTEFTGHESLEEVLECAISAEKASIDFYVGVKECVSPAQREKVDEILQEEMRHIVKLKDYLQKLY